MSRPEAVFSVPESATYLKGYGDVRFGSLELILSRYY